ncbi:hypothetical protein HY486_03930 [Candidatus Woesearchaeota archaeon]|nr:hypothetical protein [Candidatus Woesearchaeota archaeon]
MYDVIGNIALLDKKIGKKSAEKLLNSHILTVMQRQNKHFGRYRLQKLVHLAGKKQTCTTHKESGVVLKVDVKKAYFSPRLASERLRIAQQIHKKEKVAVFFSGISPYPLILAKHSPATKIVGIEWNPVAHKLAQENIVLNKLHDKIVLVKGNVRTCSMQHGTFDRIILMHPSKAVNYIDTAVGVAKKKCVIHLYTFAKEKAIVLKGKKLLEKIRALGRTCKMLNQRKTAQVAPGKYRMCYDILLKSR